MFTGIIEHVGIVAELHPFRVRAPFSAPIGASVAVNGVCLTVVDSEGALRFDLSEETLARTALDRLAVGERVNLERPLGAGAELGGHFVQGHVDGVGALTHMETLDASWLMRFAAPCELFEQLIPKGSIAIDGISLTVVDLLPTCEFTVAIIPHTWEFTNLRDRQPGDAVNLETDVLGKYVRRFLEAQRGNQG